ncbi:MAG TPA: RND transporter [Bacteroidetes bacterium]|nr:RND transporter [Bacteroidota bacterium]
MKRIFQAALLISIPFLWMACGKKAESVSPEYRDLTEAVYASGNLYPVNEYRLFANTEGTLFKSFVEAGDKVKAGSALFMIDREVDLSRLNAAANALEISTKNGGENSPVLAEQRAALNSAKEKYQQDSLNYVRYQELYKKEAVNLKTLEQFKLAYELSRNEYMARQQAYRRTKDQLRLEQKNAQSNYEAILQSYNEHAPVSRINGMVYEVLKEEGESVRRGELLAILGASDSMIIRLQVDELDIRKIKLGQQVIIRFDIDQDKIYTARITRIFPKLNKADQSFRVEAAFDEQGPSGFYGLTLEANIVVAKKDHVLSIPRELLLPGDSVIILKDKEEQKVKIQAGAMDWDFVEVLGGIDENTSLKKR